MVFVCVGVAIIDALTKLHANEASLVLCGKVSVDT